MLTDDLPIAEIVQLLAPDYDNKINHKITPTENTCTGIYDPPWTLRMAR